MKNLVRFLAVAGSVASISATTVQPASAQWGSYGLSRQQIELQRGNGWSSGDYFGLGGGPRSQYQRVSNDYSPGMDQNIRYRSNSCAQYIYC
jgi:opacity protein-like surface antigen